MVFDDRRGKEQNVRNRVAAKLKNQLVNHMTKADIVPAWGVSFGDASRFCQLKLPWTVPSRCPDCHADEPAHLGVALLCASLATYSAKVRNILCLRRIPV